MSEPTKRFDPPSRPVDGDINSQARIRNVPPDRVVCLANPNDYDTGVQGMQQQGWVIERHTKDGLKVLGGETAKDGDALTVNGQVVMTKSRALHEEYERSKHGMADLRSRAIGQPGGIDGVRGANGRLAQYSDDPREQPVRG